MNPHIFYAGSTTTLSVYKDAQCTGTPSDVSNTIGKCEVSSASNDRYKFTSSATTGGSPVSAPTTAISPVSSPTTVISPVSSPTTVISPVSSPTTSGALTGYGFKAFYLESSCSTFISGAVVPLNTCIAYVNGDILIDVKVTATSSTYLFQQYSDSTCTAAVGTASPKPYTAECSSTKQKFFIQSSMLPPVSKDTVTVR
jgi:hypothetical protein